MKKGALQKVTILEGGSFQFCLTKIRLLKVTVFEMDVFKLYMGKKCKLYHAVLKIKFQQKFSAVTELHAKQFAVHKFYLLQAGILEFDQTSIATIKEALDEAHPGEVDAVEVAVDELALFIAPPIQLLFPEIDFFKFSVFGETALHGSKKMSATFVQKPSCPTAQPCQKRHQGPVLQCPAWGQARGSTASENQVEPHLD